MEFAAKMNQCECEIKFLFIPITNLNVLFYSIKFNLENELQVFNNYWTEH